MPGSRLTLIKLAIVVAAITTATTASDRTVETSGTE
jgi:hypothetical protein